MSDIAHLLSQTSHRAYAIPASRWIYYQEWNKVLFLHWEVPLEALRKSVPHQLNLDTYEEKAYISLVAFSMQNVRPRNLPAVDFISDFDEINVRTYVKHHNIPGVYFMNIEAEKPFSAFLARMLSGLPYERSTIHSVENTYASSNERKEFFLNTDYEIKEELTSKSKLDHWLTERYCTYFTEDERVYRYDVHHPEWPIRRVDLRSLNLNYQFGDIQLNGKPDFVHYSEGVKVVTWKRTAVD